MRRFLYLFLIGVTFFLVSCEDVKEVPKTTPNLELIGDVSLVIEQGQPFIDPGVNIVGDFDLDVKTESNVDVDTIGTYHITYTVEYSGVSYDVSRSVVVVNSVLFNLDLEITDFLITDGAASFTVSLEDENKALLSTFVVIYSGDEIITSYPFTTGTKSISYEEFLPNTSYRIELEGQYLNGNERVDISGYFIEFTTSDFSIATPTVTLTGDKDIYINVYDEFIDPGAEVSDGFNLEVTAVSTVDVYTMGDYTITYSVEYEGEAYSVVRNVHVIDFQSLIGDMNISFTTSNLMYTTFDSFVSITDPNGYLKDITIVLTKEAEMIKEYDINNGDNIFYFSDLEEGTTYELNLIGTFDNGTVELDLTGYSYTLTTKVNTGPTVSLVSSEAKARDYDFTVSIIDEYSKVVSAEAIIYKDDVVYDTLTLSVGENDYSFSGIEESNDYRVDVVLTYLDANSYPKVEIIVLDSFTTLALPAPSILSDLCIAGTTTVECSMEMDLTGFSDVTIYYSIFIGYSVMDSLSLVDGATSLIFENLEDNQEYTIKISTTYTDDASGETYMYERVKILTVTTEEIVTYTAPSVENLVVTPSFIEGKPTITVSFDLLDPDNTIDGFLYFYLKSGGYNRKVEQPTVGHNEYVYTDYPIYENTEYSALVKATYKVSAEETLYEQEITTLNVVTPVQMSVVDFETINTFFVGDNVILIVELDNDKNMDVNSITINNVVYDTFIFPSNNSKLYIDMGLFTQIDDIDYTLSAVTVTLVDGSSYDIQQNEVLNVIVHEVGTFIPNDATINVLEITTNNHTDVVQDNVDNTTNVSIVVENKYNLPITKIVINGTTYMAGDFVVENNTVSITVPLSGGNNGYKVIDFEFENDGITVDADISKLSRLHIFGYESEDIVHISTVEQFLAMSGTNRTYYILDNDLDFTGVAVNPLGTFQDSFGGCFDGNGFTLSNIYMSTTVANEVNGTYAGLFGYSYAYLYDITIDNIDIVVNSDGANYLYVGTLAGNSSGKIYNTQVIGNSSITVNGIVKGFVGGLVGNQDSESKYLYANVDIDVNAMNIDDGDSGTSSSVAIGGLFGGVEENLDASHSSGKINVINVEESHYYVGGLVGNLGGDESSYAQYIYISNSYSTVDITTENVYHGRTGGLVGKSIFVYTNSGVINSYASGTIHADSGKVAGLIGDGGCTIYNSFSTSSVSTINATIGRLIPGGYDTRISNSYKYDGQVLISHGEIIDNGADTHNFSMVTASSNEYNDVSFYNVHLHWSSHFYNYLNLDVENGDLPVFN
jgi:hypothetical protein